MKEARERKKSAMPTSHKNRSGTNYQHFFLANFDMYIYLRTRK